MNIHHKIWNIVNIHNKIMNIQHIILNIVNIHNKIMNIQHKISNIFNIHIQHKIWHMGTCITRYRIYITRFSNKATFYTPYSSHMNGIYLASYYCSFIASLRSRSCMTLSPVKSCAGKPYVKEGILQVFFFYRRPTDVWI